MLCNLLCAGPFFITPVWGIVRCDLASSRVEARYSVNADIVSCSWLETGNRFRPSFMQMAEKVTSGLTAVDHAVHMILASFEAVGREYGILAANAPLLSISAKGPGGARRSELTFQR